MTEERDDIVVLYGEEGEELEFEHLDTIEHKGETYFVLLPLSEDEDEGVLIFKAEHDEVGEEVLVVVESDDEAEAVFQIFKERMEELGIEDDSDDGDDEEENDE
jgi:uncharacterized protein YrzB (UPF0473 family)